LLKPILLNVVLQDLTLSFFLFFLLFYGWLERCMQAMAMNLSKAELWKNLRSLRKVL